jgi:hypothetical protein
MIVGAAINAEDLRPYVAVSVGSNFGLALITAKAGFSISQLTLEADYVIMFVPGAKYISCLMKNGLI